MPKLLFVKFCPTFLNFFFPSLFNGALAKMQARTNESIINLNIVAIDISNAGTNCVGMNATSDIFRFVVFDFKVVLSILMNEY